ncbi:hypothetical protein EVJ58_g1023 [Rhodofomes roseus]|uniref:ERCC4 domain-containing protein n=1 Tax=Rhodofomes roseus TaxID=34475 RepID=A0A4Y9Z3D9_9APHY|nr:hypothetical protein EVJ58_g1023 [Rhodofomes roseus]
MLSSDIPTKMITGIIMLHAEKVTPTSSEAFIVRLYREKNTTGFLKAFSDQPEHITSGMSPLRTILKESQLRTVHIYPRFHAEVKESLDVKRPDLVELHQNMTESMSEIHHAIVQCMTTTLSDLKRANTSLDLDDLNMDNAYFKSFDMIVRRMLDPVWHKVGPRTKQLVGDLAVLRRMLTYLLTYDAIAFQGFIDTLIASNTTTDAGTTRQNQSPWMLTDAANIIFQYAKRRCYTVNTVARKAQAPAPDPYEDEDAWEALYEMEGNVPNAVGGTRAANKQASGSKRPSWLPDGMEPVLDEQPKLSLLADVLQEIEEEMMRLESKLSSLTPGTNTVLVMTSSTRTCELVSEFLSMMDYDAPRGSQGRRMMEKKLKGYLWWKGELNRRKQHAKGLPVPAIARTASGAKDSGDAGVSEALRRKDRETRERLANRRRVRGGAPPQPSSGREKSVAPAGASGDPIEVLDDAESIAAFLSTQGVAPEYQAAEDIALIDFTTDFNVHYGLLAPEQTVVVRPYTDDGDDLVLREVQPRFIVMFEPNLEFIRRIEVYRNSNPGLGVRVYFMMYRLSSEEGKYLTGLRREKESFERLIRERGSMLMPIMEDRNAGRAGEALIKTISSRVAGGRKEVSLEPSRVIVDLREFRSSLPSLLHAANLLVIPATLTVGDYILTPDICVERKSIPDLVSSFNSGLADVKSYAKVDKFAKKKPTGAPNSTNSASASIQAKLVLLTLTFPRLRIIWSSSPYATADIFRDLKANSPEPDPTKAIVVGAEEDPDAGAGVNAVAEELVQSLPGITAKNVKHVMSKVESVLELCELSLVQMQELLGAEPGKACWDFIHSGERQR